MNAKNSSGDIYTLTAGHCPGDVWYMNWNRQSGTETYNGFGGTLGNQALTKADDPNINPLGTVRYWGGHYHQIYDSAWPTVGVDIDRIGVSSQDKTGYITAEVVTVNLRGTQVEGLFETNVCALHGDSGGPALRGNTALGLLSGGTDETECASSTSGTYWNYFMPVQRVLNQHGLHVY